jgi:hypothetical protein
MWAINSTQPPRVGQRSECVLERGKSLGHQTRLFARDKQALMNVAYNSEVFVFDHRLSSPWRLGEGPLSYNLIGAKPEPSGRVKALFQKIGPNPNVVYTDASPTDHHSRHHAQVRAIGALYAQPFSRAAGSQRAPEPERFVKAGGL